jgi:hypothetical protein
MPLSTIFMADLHIAHANMFVDGHYIRRKLSVGFNWFLLTCCPCYRWQLQDEGLYLFFWLFTLGHGKSVTSGRSKAGFIFPIS